MIVVPFKPKTIICTPTKTGTEALLSVLTRRSRFGQRIMPKHRATVPDEYASFHRVLVVRNPWNRLVSMFYYLRKMHGSWGKGSFISFAEFCEYHQYRCKHKPSVDWTWNFCDYANVFQQQEVWHTENLESDCVGRFGLHFDLPPFRQINVTTDRTKSYEAHWTKKLRQLVAPWAEPDAEMFGYEKG